MEPTTTSQSTKISTLSTNPVIQTSDDKYTASIELSNACREFYRSRIKAAEVARKRLQSDASDETGSDSAEGTSSSSSLSSSSSESNRKKTTIDVAMEQLRREMASLMDQDLSLMKQLLILNEAIEDLKVQRGYLSSRGSLPSSSCDLSESQWSVSETEMFESENELTNKYPSPSTLSLNNEDKTKITSDFDDIINEANEKLCITKKLFDKKSTPSSQVTGDKKNNAILDNNKNIFVENDFNASKRARHEEQNSFDSGIHEPHYVDSV